MAIRLFWRVFTSDTGGHRLRIKFGLFFYRKKWRKKEEGGKRDHQDHIHIQRKCSNTSNVVADKGVFEKIILTGNTFFRKKLLIPLHSRPFNTFRERNRSPPPFLEIIIFGLAGIAA